MSYLAKIAGFLFILISVVYCSEEVQVNAPGESVPVVYGLLNPDAGVQYVRLGRTFLQDPTVTGKPPVTDSTVWNVPVDVYVEECKEGIPVRRFQFEPSTTTVKDTGFFSEGNLRLYRSDFKPNRLTTYRLYVHFPNDNRLVYGSAFIPDVTVVEDPLSIPGRKISLQSEINYTVRWVPPPKAGLYQCHFYVTYQEDRDGDLSFHEILFGNDPAIETTYGSTVSWILSGKRFFQEAARQIPVKPDVKRKVVNVRFRFYTGGEELAFQVSPDIVPSMTSPLNPYTNLLNGIGVFSSIQVLTVDNLELSNTTIYELSHGELTRNLGFTDIHGSDLNNSR